VEIVGPFVGHTIAVHDGRGFAPVLLTQEMLGKRLGDVVPARPVVRGSARSGRYREATFRTTTLRQRSPALERPVGHSRPARVAERAPVLAAHDATVAEMLDAGLTAFWTLAERWALSGAEQNALLQLSDSTASAGGGRALPRVNRSSTGCSSSCLRTSGRTR